MHALFGLAGLPLSEWKHFQQHKELEAVLKQLNPEASRYVSSDKVQFSRHCEAHGIAHIQTIYHDVLDEDQALSETERREAFWRCIERTRHSLFFKPLDGAHGADAFIAERRDTRWLYCDERGSTEDLYKFCRKRQNNSRGWLVQPVLKSHSDLQEISSRQALSTVRLLTCITPDGPLIMLGVLKLARELNQTDNFSFGLTGNMVAEIDIDSGRLGAAKGSLRRDFPCTSSFVNDPNTGQRIAGRLVPYWEEAKSLVLQAQETLPELISLGWDVAITDRGPVVVEANSNYASEIMEVAYGRGLRPFFINRLKQLA